MTETPSYAHLTLLGQHATQPASPDDAVLERVANPEPGKHYIVRLTCPEFTSLCPLTGQPDFAQFTIEMVANRLCVELKSLKLYLWSYRNEGAFHEKVTNAILDDIVAATKPRFARIQARWNVRGGIYTNVSAEHCARDWTGRAALLGTLAAKGPRA
jgi:7-cyano-7-deazaguanine reductase